MNAFLLYLLLLKATLISFSGLTSLPVVRHDLVEHRGVLTDRQLNAAVAAGRTAPGPNGLYLASVGYFVAGAPGAVAGTLALITPAFLIIPLLRYLGTRAERPAVRSATQAVMLAAAGLILNATVPLARDALTGPLAVVIATGSFLFLALTKRATLWVIAAAGVLGVGSWVLGPGPAAGGGAALSPGAPTPNPQPPTPYRLYFGVTPRSFAHTPSQAATVFRRQRALFIAAFRFSSSCSSREAPRMTQSAALWCSSQLSERLTSERPARSAMQRSSSTASK